MCVICVFLNTICFPFSSFPYSFPHCLSSLPIVLFKSTQFYHYFHFLPFICLFLPPSLPPSLAPSLLPPSLLPPSLPPSLTQSLTTHSLTHSLPPSPLPPSSLPSSPPSLNHSPLTHSLPPSFPSSLVPSYTLKPAPIPISNTSPHITSATPSHPLLLVSTSIQCAACTRAGSSTGHGSVLRLRC